MRHLVSGRKLGRTTEHRLALFRNLACSLIDKERIETTLAKAKELQPFADRLVTLGKRNSLWAKRQAFDFLRSRQDVVKLFGDLALRFQERKGGYTRVLKLGFRQGDASAMALIEYVVKGGNGVPPKGKGGRILGLNKEMKKAVEEVKKAKETKEEPKGFKRLFSKKKED